MIERLARGDPQAWSEFLDRYRRLIYSAIHRVNGRFGAGWDEAAMEDVFEEAVFKLLRRNGKALRSWRGQCKLETWIFRIVRNVCIDCLRRELRRSEMTESGGERDLVERSREPAAARGAAHDLRLSLEQAIDRCLGSREALAIRMIYFEGFTYREVADRMGMSVGAMSGLVYRALAKLRDAGGLGDTRKGG